LTSNRQELHGIARGKQAACQVPVNPGHVCEPEIAVESAAHLVTVQNVGVLTLRVQPFFQQVAARLGFAWPTNSNLTPINAD